MLTILVLWIEEGGEQAVLDLASALSGYKGMESLHIRSEPLATRAVVDALVDAAISAGIKDMSFIHCDLSQTALPALTRLLQSPDFERLKVWNRDMVVLFEGPALPAFCEALRNSKSLNMLGLGDNNLWADVTVATQLIAALEELPALHELWMRYDSVHVTRLPRSEPSSASAWRVSSNAAPACGNCTSKTIPWARLVWRPFFRRWEPLPA